MSREEIVEKVSVLVHHWISHNDEHAEEYRKWAEKLEEEGLVEIAEPIRQAADLILSSNAHFRSAKEKLEEVK